MKRPWVNNSGGPGIGMIVFLIIVLLLIVLTCVAIYYVYQTDEEDKQTEQQQIQQQTELIEDALDDSNSVSRENLMSVGKSIQISFTNFNSNIEAERISFENATNANLSNLNQMVTTNLSTLDASIANTVGAN